MQYWVGKKLMSFLIFHEFQNRFVAQTHLLFDFTSLNNLTLRSKNLAAPHLKFLYNTESSSGAGRAYLLRKGGRRMTRIYAGYRTNSIRLDLCSRELKLHKTYNKVLLENQYLPKRYRLHHLSEIQPDYWNKIHFSLQVTIQNRENENFQAIFSKCSVRKTLLDCIFQDHDNLI